MAELIWEVSLHFPYFSSLLCHANVVFTLSNQVSHWELYLSCSLHFSLLWCLESVEIKHGLYFLDFILQGWHLAVWICILNCPALKIIFVKRAFRNVGLMAVRLLCRIVTTQPFFFKTSCSVLFLKWSNRDDTGPREGTLALPSAPY